jgi:FkbM family methyltransferase
MNYAYCFSHIDISDIRFIIELGARDCKDSITLATHFNCPVLAFECNPHAIKPCKETLAAHTPPLPITLIEQAVSLYTGETTFYSIPAVVNSNIGASSCFPHMDNNFVNHMEKITVPCTRLDDILTARELPTPDLICMDIQGSELNAIKGLGSRIRECKAIATETSFVSSYEGGHTFSELYSYLLEHDFTIAHYPFSLDTIAKAMKGNIHIPGDFDVVFTRDV